MSTHRAPTYDDILDAIMVAEPEPTHAALMRWIAKYPEHRARLSSFFATWAVQAELPEKTKIDADRVGAAVVAHAMKLLDEREATSDERLSAAARRAGLSTNELAAKCEIDDTIVAKLDRRLIRLASIPSLCLERIGSAIGQSVDAVRAMLDGPPIALAGARYKAKKLRAPSAQDFLEAVNASTLTAEQKQRWADTNVAKR